MLFVLPICSYVFLLSSHRLHLLLLLVISSRKRCTIQASNGKNGEEERVEVNVRRKGKEGGRQKVKEERREGGRKGRARRRKLAEEREKEREKKKRKKKKVPIIQLCQ